MIRNIVGHIQADDRRLAELRMLDLTETIVAVDFDGTCVTHDFPRVGQAVPGAEIVLKALTDAGARLILHTVRGDRDGKAGLNELVSQKGDVDYATQASLWFHDNRIPLWALNCNPDQASWSNSPKSYAHLYIDDAALGCPLVFNATIHSRPFVDWDVLLTMLPWYLKTLPQVRIVR